MDDLLKLLKGFKALSKDFRPGQSFRALIDSHFVAAGGIAGAIRILEAEIKTVKANKKILSDLMQ